MSRTIKQSEQFRVRLQLFHTTGNKLLQSEFFLQLSAVQLCYRQHVVVYCSPLVTVLQCNKLVLLHLDCVWLSTSVFVWPTFLDLEWHKLVLWFGSFRQKRRQKLGKGASFHSALRSVTLQWWLLLPSLWTKVTEITVLTGTGGWRLRDDIKLEARRCSLASYSNETYWQRTLWASASSSYSMTPFECVCSLLSRFDKVLDTDSAKGNTDTHTYILVFLSLWGLS